jgi:hypothetical protein
MKAIKVFLLMIILVVLVAAGLVYQAGLGVERTVFNPEFYDAVLRETGLSGAVQEALLEAVGAEMAEEIPDQIRDQLIDALARSFSPAWMDEQISANVRVLIDYLDGRRGDLAMAVDLTGPKAALLEELNAALAGMSLEELFALGLEVESIDRLGEAFLAQLDLPDRMPIAVLSEIDDPEMVRGLEGLKQYRRYFAYMPYLFFGVAAVLCLLLAGLPGGLKWFGSGVLVSGALFSLFWLGVSYFAALPAGALVSSLPPGGDFFEGATGMATALIRFVAGRFLLVTAVYTAAGLLLVLVGSLLRVLARGKRAAA